MSEGRAGHYDLVVVGTGSGNTIVDDRFADRRVAIIEPGPFGGTCLNRGCIPSKMLVHTADLVDAVTGSEPFEVDATLDRVRWDAVRDRVFDRIDEVADSGREYRQGLSNVDVYAGTCRFTGERRLAVAADDGDHEITADAVVLATGSRPVVPPIEGLDEVHHHTSDDVMRLPALPRRLGVVGGGYVGCELAHVFSSLGSHVVQVESAPRLIDVHDADVAQVLTDTLSRRWAVRCSTQLSRVSQDGDVITMTLSDGDEVEVDALLVAVGRRPNGDTLDLEQGGVEHEEGRIVVDAYQRTSAAGVWALGDASTAYPLKHVANHEARVVQHNLLHPDDLVASDHRFVPQAVFTEPQVASVGLTEQQARDEGIDVVVGVGEHGSTAQGWARRLDDSGFIVKLVGDRHRDRIVGAHLIGPESSSLIQPLLMAMELDVPASTLARSQYWIHPALTETVEAALLDLGTRSTS